MVALVLRVGFLSIVISDQTGNGRVSIESNGKIHCRRVLIKSNNGPLLKELNKRE